MKKKIWKLSIIIFAIIMILMIAVQLHHNVKETIVNYVNVNYDDLEKAASNLLKYKEDDIFYLIGHNQTELYVDHDIGDDGEFIAEPIHDKTIQEVFELKGITEIYRGKNSII